MSGGQSTLASFWVHVALDICMYVGASVGIMSVHISGDSGVPSSRSRPGVCRRRHCQRQDTHRKVVVPQIQKPSPSNVALVVDSGCGLGAFLLVLSGEDGTPDPITSGEIEYVR